jgi:HSP20 family protein
LSWNNVTTIWLEVESGCVILTYCNEGFGNNVLKKCGGLELDKSETTNKSNLVKHHIMFITKNTSARKPQATANLVFNDDFFRDFFAPNVKQNWGTIPSANIKESKDSFGIELAAPGLEKQDFKITLEEHTLKISSEKKIENKLENERYTRKEFHFNSFERTFELPETVDPEKIQASYSNGVLHVTLPKREVNQQSSSRSIQVI